MSTSRSRATTALLLGCEGCGESRIYLLAVHHKDGDRKNNRTDNLEPVCGRCHGVRHLEYFWDIRSWSPSTKVLTPRLVVKHMDKYTQNPSTSKRAQIIENIRLDYLSRYAEDAQNGTDFDMDILDFLDAMEYSVTHVRPLQDYAEEAFG